MWPPPRHLQSCCGPLHLAAPATLPALLAHVQAHIPATALFNLARLRECWGRAGSGWGSLAERDGSRMSGLSAKCGQAQCLTGQKTPLLCLSCSCGSD